ncbi:MAG: amino acid ABC transporter permease [Deltaproteobacteria bacterium CG03_land_8_20_14_0_80_45_14]|nr:MAG: amino acid ABC transporter permease [Deltaproteobacteria bacterium CG03_land_8_20_14_0_80_45_14]
MELATQLIAYGILMGLVFALIALGLSLIFGVMNIVNFAHGEFMMVGMYVAFIISSYFHLDPLISLPFAAAIGYLLGVVSYHFLIHHILRGPMVAQLFGTFGLMLFLRYLAMFIFTPDVRSIKQGILVGKTLSIGWLTIDVSKGVSGGLCLLSFALVYWIIHRTKLGRALRATSIDAEAARYMGIDTKKMNALAWGIGGATVALAGALLAHYYYITPTIGMLFTIIAFATVALGGFGSIVGAFLAGLMIGLIMVLSGQYVSELKFTFIYILYFLVVVFRPRGLFGW